MQVYYIERRDGSYVCRGGYSTRKFEEASIYPKLHVAERRAKERGGEVKILNCYREGEASLGEVHLVMCTWYDETKCVSVRADLNQAMLEAEQLNLLAKEQDDGNTYEVVTKPVETKPVPEIYRIHTAKMSLKGNLRVLKPHHALEVPAKVFVKSTGVVIFSALSREGLDELILEYRRNPIASVTDEPAENP